MRLFTVVPVTVVPVTIVPVTIVPVVAVMAVVIDHCREVVLAPNRQANERQHAGAHDRGHGNIGPSPTQLGAECENDKERGER